MRPLRWRTLVVITSIAFGLTAVGTWSSLRGGSSPVDVPWTTVLVGAGAAIAVIVMAWGVRQYKKGKRPRIDPQRAVRTVLLAQASAYAGALLLGVYGGYGVMLLPDWSHEPRREIAIAAGLSAIGGLLMLVAGVIGESWCRIGPDDDDDHPEGPAAGVAH